MPRPGKPLLKRFHREKVPVYRQASLVVQSVNVVRARIFHLENRMGKTDLRSQGSYRGVPVDCWKARMLKPVMLGLGPRAAARSTLIPGLVLAMGTQLEGRRRGELRPLEGQLG
jgi:hypothetical protein